MKQVLIFILLFNFYSCHFKSERTLSQLKSDSLSKRCEYYIMVDKLDSAQYFVDQALVSDSLNYAAYDNRAVLKYRQHKPSAEIVNDFETSLRINPGNETALFSLVNYYDETGDYTKAEEVGNHYVFQYGWNYLKDSIHLNGIKRIILKAERNEKLHIHVTTASARAFYDSVNTILRKSDSVQQRFVNNVAFVMMRFFIGKSNTGVDYLKKSFDSSVAANEISIKKISLITEVDSVTNYKLDALKYCLVFKHVYQDKLGGFIYCLESKDFLLIKNCTVSTKPSLFALKKAGTDLKVSSKKFRTKYLL
ncbi:MAG: hypothetical protein ABIO56_04300 [Ferruginibacter sp.]